VSSELSRHILEEVEVRVPTRLVERPISIDGSYGGFFFVRELVRAPGVILAEAHDTMGLPWLLQIVRMPKALDGTERLAQQHLERIIGLRTAELLDEPGLGLAAHGAVDELDGPRAIYWVLPWHPRAAELGQKARPSLDTVLAAGIALARRLRHRHERGRCDPLLSAAAVVINETVPALLGFPVLVPSIAYAPDMVAPLLAPEEVLSGQPRQSGDLWRLGMVLRAWVEGDALASLLDCLLEADPERRIARASQIEAELESIGSRRGMTDSTATFAAMDPTALSELLLEATADPTTCDTAQPISAQHDLEEALGLAPQIEVEIDGPITAPALAPVLEDLPVPPPSPLSIALRPFVSDLPPSAGIILRVLDDEPHDPTMFRTRMRPIVERIAPVESGVVDVLPPTRITRRKSRRARRRAMMAVAFTTVGLVAMALGVAMGALIPR